MSAMVPSTTVDEELQAALVTLVRLADRLRLLEREVAVVFRGIEEVAEILYNRAVGVPGA